MENFCKIGKLEKKKIKRVSEYLVCRGERQKGDLRYDLTLIFPKRFGNEIPRTFGHYHKKKYPEIMEVISGHAWFLIQRRGKDQKKISETYLIDAGEKEKIIMLPEFGHISINPTKKNLILANWMSIKEESDYKDYKKFNGGCYRAIKNKKGIILEKNKNYKNVPEIIRLKPKEIPEFDIVRKKNLYSLIKNKKNLSFLNEPKKYKNLLTINKCFKKI